LRIEDAFDSRWWARVGGRNELKERNLGVDLGDEGNQTHISCSLIIFNSKTFSELLLSSLQHANDSSPLAALLAYLSSLPTTTATQSTLKTLTRILLLYTALSTSSSHLLLGTTLTGLSIGLISGVAMGGGFVVREEAGEEWVPRIGGMAGEKRSIKVVRPLRDMGMKECAAWVWWNGLEVVGKENVAGAKQGIGGLTKSTHFLSVYPYCIKTDSEHIDFIVGLERDYPSTVSTIARTCAKLAPKDAANERCALCERYIY
jgi:cytoplasmic tRNA 2-thiolation protein 2